MNTASAAVQADWQGPPLRAQFGADGGPLRLSLQAPTGGFEFKLDEVRAAGDDANVLVTVMRPGRQEAVPQMLQEHAIEVPLAKLPAGCKTVSVHVADIERGASYFRTPDHNKVLALPRPQ